MSAYVPWRRVVEAVEQACECGGSGKDAPPGNCTACWFYHRLKDEAVTVRVAPAYSLEVKPATEEDLAT